MPPKIIIVPGLGDSAPDHWQSLWQQEFEHARVKQDDFDNPSPQTWAARLEEVIQATSNELVLVGHSCGVLTIAHWAKLYTLNAQDPRIKGAFLVAPPDAEQQNMSELCPAVCQMAPMPLQRLPFSSIVVASSNDPYVSMARAQTFANFWGGELISIGEADHISASSNLGDWPMGKIFLKSMFLDRTL